MAENINANLLDSPKEFLTDDHIINTQGIVSEDEMNIKKTGNNESQDDKLKVPIPTDETQLLNKRRSERLVKEITMTTQEKNEVMARKRNLEGLYSEIDKAEIEKGVDLMVKVAMQFLATKKAKHPNGTGGQVVQDDQEE